MHDTRRFRLAAALLLAAIVATPLVAAAVSSGAVTYGSDRVFLGSTYHHGKFVEPPLVVVIADFPADAGTVAAPYTLRPTTGSVQLSCADTDGCDITLSEVGAEDGTIVRISNTSSNVCNFADTSGVTETASSFAMGQYDALTLIYASDRWVELGRSNN